MSADISTWFVPPMWKDGAAWILGGGYSMPRQFGVPESVIQRVMTGVLPRSSYSEYFSEIHAQHIIGTNLAYTLGDWVSVLYFGDYSFFRNNKLDLHNFKNLKVTDTGNLVRQYQNHLQVHKRIKKLKRDLRMGLSDDPTELRWNASAGGGAINLACHFGVKRIYLLGFDMNPNTDGQTHWHGNSAGYRKPTEDRTFIRFLKAFPVIAADAKKRGIEILNVSPTSAIKDFPKVSLKEIL